MKNTRSLLVVLALSLSLTGTSAITFSSNTAIGVGNTTYDGQDIVVSGCTLTVDGPHAFTSLVVMNGGTVTHSPAPNGEPNNRLDLTIAGNLTIAPASTVSVLGRGYAPRSGPGAGANSWPGTGGGGGGHGGRGGAGAGGPAGGAGNDLLAAPEEFGSGGGERINDSDGAGSAGGGFVRLVVAGTLRVDGSINASGANTYRGLGGAGAGGSVYLNTSTLTGTGSILANGGDIPDGNWSGGGGGGGRIAAYFTANEFAGSLSARGGSALSGQKGGAGTVFLKSTEGVAQVTLDNAGLNGAQTRLNPNQWPAGMVFDLTVRGNTVLCPEMPLALAGLHVLEGATITHDAQQLTLVLSVLGDAQIGANTAISAAGLGFGPASGPGAGTSSGSYYGSGAGHGGVGGWSSRGSSGPGGTYDFIYAPTNFGSGGGYPWSGNAGYGGGAVRLVVAGELRLDGSIVANGTSCTDGGGGGGSGGSICLTAGTLSGGGAISAAGGSGGGSSGGGGAGGRIAIHADTNAFTGSWLAGGGSGANRGGAGTICLKLSSASTAIVWVDNGGNGGGLTRLNPNQWPASERFALVVNAGALVYPDAGITVAALTVTSNSWLGHGILEQPVCFAVRGDTMIDSTSGIYTDGRGYGPASGPGAGTSSGSYYGSGAGHGGAGGWSWRGSSGPGGPYGSMTLPTTFGSGGGNPYVGYGGGSGGGAVRLEVAGNLRLDGSVSADAMSSTENGGGGAGGSVLLIANTLTGTGSIAAKGGSGGDGGGGGGGGRVAIYGDVSAFLVANINVSGGSGANYGQNGTLFLTNTLPPLEVSSFIPTGLVRQAVSGVDVAFNQSVRSETFTLADVVITIPEGTSLEGQVSVTPLSTASFRIGFPPQTAAGIYQVQFGPHIENLYGVEMAEACLGSFAIVNPILSGVVRLTNGLPLAEVTLRAGTSATTTDPSGFFTLPVPPGWSGMVTPDKTGFSFVPASRSYVNVSDNQTNQDFTALVPTIVGPADQNLLVGQNCTAALPDYTGQATATNFTGPVTITQDPVAGTLLGPGGHPVILRASDAFNHLATCSLTVTAADQIPPVLACPPNRTLVADAQMQATLPDLTGQATASDNCGTPSLSQVPVAGTRLAPGSHPVTLTARDAANNSTNCSMTVTVVPPPSLTVAPQDCTNAAGSSVTFTVTAGGTAPLSYQWRLNGTNLSDGGSFTGTTSNALTVANLQASHAGVFSILVTDAYSSITGQVAVLSVISPPSILQGPQSTTIVRGGTAAFHVLAAGTAPLGYQWYAHGSALANDGRISGATGPDLSVAGVQSGDAGNYAVVVTNSLGAATSAPAAVLTVVLPPDSANPQVHQTVPTGGRATFTIEATGTPPLHYRWLVNGVGLAGAPDSPALIIGSATAELTGQIGVVVSNDYGAITNVVGTLSLVDLKMFAGVVISGLVGSHYRIEATPALADPPQWTTAVSDLAIPSSPYVWVDMSSPGQEKRFYRAVPLP